MISVVTRAMCLILLGGTLNAISVRTCDSEPSSKNITIVLDDKTATASRYFCVVADGPVTKLILDSTDLTSRDTSFVIDQSNIRLAQESGLQSKQDTKVLVNFTGLNTPGRYEGRIEFRDSSMRQGSGAIFSLQLSVVPKPHLTFLPASPTFGHVSCEFKWECRVLGWLTSQSLVASATPVAVVNQTRGPIEIDNISLAVRGDHTGALLTEASWKPSSTSVIIPENQTKVIDLTIPEHIGPDKYQGSLRIIIKDLEDVTSTALVLNVRDGPILPLVVILIGIGMGRVVQITNSPQLQMQTRLLQHLYALEYASQSIVDVQMTRYLKEKFADALQSIELATENDVQTPQKLEAIQSALQMWTSVQRARELISLIQDPAKRAALSKMADDVIAYLLADDAINLQNASLALQRALNAPPLDSSGGGLARPPLSFTSRNQRAPQGFERILLSLSGGLPVSAQTAYRYLIPLGFVVLLLSLAAFGYYTYYLRAGDTFGAGGASDYLPLFFWGFSVDIAQRTLQMIPIARS